MQTAQNGIRMRAVCSLRRQGRCPRKSRSKVTVSSYQVQSIAQGHVFGHGLLRAESGHKVSVRRDFDFLFITSATATAFVVGHVVCIYRVDAIAAHDTIRHVLSEIDKEEVQAQQSFPTSQVKIFHTSPRNNEPVIGEEE